MTINERFFSLLESHNCTQKSFCDKTGVSNKTISAWKARKSDPPANLISTIADFFNVSTEYLLTGKETLAPLQSLFAEDEKEIIKNYQSLDNRGRHQLHSAIYKELDRIKEEKMCEERPIPFAASGEANITQENYEKIQKKLKEFDKRALELKGG